MLKHAFILTIITIGSMGILMLAGCQSDTRHEDIVDSTVETGTGQVTGDQIYSTGVNKDNITVWITNSNGSKTPITLKRSGAGYIGPRNEVYQALPTEAEIKKVYGF